jgi:hypothetical protein
MQKKYNAPGKEIPEKLIVYGKINRIPTPWLIRSLALHS